MLLSSAVPVPTYRLDRRLSMIPLALPLSLLYLSETAEQITIESSSPFGG